MRNLFFLLAVILLFLFVSCSENIFGPKDQTSASLNTSINKVKTNFNSHAYVQIIHNSDDYRARVVDIYVNGSKALDNFKYRKATPFLELPTDLEVGVAPKNSKNEDDIIANFDFDLVSGEYYVVIADGVLNPWRFGSNPESIPINFNLYPYTNGELIESSTTDKVALLVFHGATDAPTVDVVARDVASLVDDLSYGNYSENFEVDAGHYILDITSSDGAITVASFNADLSGLGGEAGVVFASGFLTPPPGPTFGLFAALSNGVVIKLPKLEDGEEDDFTNNRIKRKIKVKTHWKNTPH